MNDIPIHLGLRFVSAFLIFYLLNYLNRIFSFHKKIIFYWYLLGVSQVCFLFFPFLKELQIPFFYLLPIKFLLVGFSFFLWVSSRVFLDHAFRPKGFHLLILTIVEVSGLTLSRVKGEVVFPNGSLAPENIVLYFIYSNLSFQFILSGLALFNIYKSCKFELNDTLLFIKRYFLVSASVSELLILLTIATNRQEHSDIRLWFVSLFNFAFLLVSYLLLKINSVGLGDRQLLTQENDLLREQFQTFLEKDIQFLFSDCSLKNIADKIDIPEYKLRKIINSDLGFQNFNQFLNYYRIREACKFLESKDHQDIPVSRIALLVGYNSIATFNRAFKDLKNVSPTQYRPNRRSSSLPSVLGTDKAY